MKKYNDICGFEELSCVEVTFDLINFILFLIIFSFRIKIFTFKSIFMEIFNEMVFIFHYNS